MKKIVAVLLVVFMFVTPIAYASSPIEMATQAKEIIELLRGQEITEYHYTSVLCITMLALTDYYRESDKSNMTVFDGLAETGDADMMNSLMGIFSTLNGAKYNKYIELVQDAEKCYTTKKFGFDVIEKHVDFLLTTK